MKKKRWRTDRLRWPGGRRREHEAEMAARLTPLEEMEEFRDSPQKDAGRGASDDTIRVDSASVRLPDRLVEGDEGGDSAFRLDAAVVVITALMLAFAAFVAWQITLMPAK